MGPGCQSPRCPRHDTGTTMASRPRLPAAPGSLLFASSCPLPPGGVQSNPAAPWSAAAPARGVQGPSSSRDPIHPLMHVFRVPTSSPPRMSHSHGRRVRRGELVGQVTSDGDVASPNHSTTVRLLHSADDRYSTGRAPFLFRFLYTFAFIPFLLSLSLRSSRGLSPTGTVFPNIYIGILRPKTLSN
jgi:hypothetical protein